MSKGQSDGVPAASLFEENEGRTVSAAEAAMKHELQVAYAAELLQNPPVRSVAHDDPHRAANAARFAAKDISRVYQAAETAGLQITVTAKEAV